MSKHVAIYTRISRDTAGDGHGVDTQRRLGLDYAAQHWPGMPVEVFEDNDRSAANGGPRPDFARLREAIDAEQVARLWVIEQSRLTRREIEWFEFAAELLAADIHEIHTHRDGVLQVDNVLSGIKALISAAESKTTKKRIRDRFDTLALEGKPLGAEIFGYVRGVNEAGDKSYLVVPEEAAIIRETADRILSGWSLNRIAQDLAGRGVRGKYGAIMGHRTIKSVMTSPSIAGKRVHRGVIAGPANWQPILDEATWRQVTAKLATPRTVVAADGQHREITKANLTKGRAARRYLLSGGVGRCGVCDGPLAARQQTQTSRDGERFKRSYYFCKADWCVSIHADHLEEHVVDELLTALDNPTFRAAVATDDHAHRRSELTDELAEVEKKRMQLAEDEANDVIDREEWLVKKVALVKRENTARAELASLPAPVSKFDLTAIRKLWPKFNLDEQREFIATYVNRVVVAKPMGGRKRGGFDERRVYVDPLDDWQA